MWILISALNEPSLIVVNEPVHFFNKHLLRFNLLLTKTKYRSFSLQKSCGSVTNKLNQIKLILNFSFGREIILGYKLHSKIICFTS